jgi:hypothetical protein
MAAFIFLMVILKIPLVALLWLVWWAVREVPVVEEEDSAEDQGGGGVHGPRPHRPRPPRRGPHGGDVPSAPARVRTPARARRAAPTRK